MKVVHLAVVTPHRAGLYETTRDLVAAERKIGIDACIVDPTVPTEDRGVPLGTNGIAKAADMLVSHSGLGEYNTMDKPIVHCLHGRPYNSFLLERTGKTPVYSLVRRMGRDPRCKEFVTFWPETVPYWEMLLRGRKIHVCSPPVDLEAWTPNGPNGYSFGGKAGDKNVVITDIWREDRTPYQAIHAFGHFAGNHSGIKLHLYGLDKDRRGVNVLLKCLAEAGVLGEVRGHVEGLAHVYRAADLLVTTQSIATRSIREALACGCPVVGPSRFASIQTDWENPVSFRRAIAEALLEPEYKLRARQIAEKEFDPRTTAEQFKALLETVA